MPEATPETPDRPRMDWREAVAAWRRLSPEEKRRITREMREREAQLQREGKLADDDIYDRYCRENTTIIPRQGEEGA